MIRWKSSKVGVHGKPGSNDTHEIEQERPEVTNYKILFGLKIL